MESAASSRAFLDKLLVRLKSGDARSIHLNALPGPFARIDVYDLIHIDPSLHLKFLNTLLSQQTFRFALHIDPLQVAQKEAEPRKILQRLVKKLNHLYYQEKEELAEHGYTSFAFGYPLLIKRDPANPDRILKAPLFIWYLNIEKDRQGNNTWILSRTEDQPVIFNEALRTHLATQEHIRTDAVDTLLQEEQLNEKQLLEACGILAEQLHIPYDAGSAIATLLPGTNKESIEQLTKSHPWIRFSGIFGLYKTQKQAIIRDIELLQDKPAQHPDFNGHLQDIEDLSPVTLDPSQEQLLHALKQHSNLVIQGPPGTGKSQSLTGIITAALLNKRNVLVVCEKRTALDVLHQNLSELGLQDLCVLIEDVYADRKAIVGRVRDKLEMPAAANRFREHAYEAARSAFLSQQEEINHRLNSVRTLFFGDDSWPELLVKSLELRADRDIATAALQLDKILGHSDFQLQFSEYQAILRHLSDAELLFEQLPEDTAGLERLPDEAIRQYTPETCRELLTGLQAQAHDLQHNLAKYLVYPAYDRLQGFAHGADRFIALFSVSRKQQLEQQASDKAAYQAWQDALNRYALPDFRAEPASPQRYMRELLPGLESFATLSGRLLNPAKSLEAYYAWRKYCLQTDTPAQQVIAALKQIRARDWKTVFSSWYIDTYIRRTAETLGLDVPADAGYDRLKKTDAELKQLLPARIRQTWEQLQSAALAQRDPAQLKFLYNQRKNKQFETRNSLRQIVHADAALFRTLFPVALVNPVVCASVFPTEPGLYDLVILDEASQLKIEETFSSLYRGKTCVISGDKHQMPPSTLFGSTVLFEAEAETDDPLGQFLADSHSLLEYANDAGFPNHYLDFHYRSRHPKLIAFSNAAFYGHRLVPMPQRSDYQPIHFYAVPGIYQDGTNPEEARRVVDFIYELERNGDAFPSIGVATFNIFQRDLILDQLWERAYANPEQLAKLEALLQQGLFVKNLENIQGDERDVMILSTTFGPDAQGRFRQLFGPLTQEKGYQLLNVIITRARQFVHVFCSIPETVFIHYRDELLQKGNTGKAVFYAYLAYVRACAAGQTEQEHAILETLARNAPKHAGSFPGNDTPALTARLYAQLQPVYDDDVRLQYPFGGFILPVAILRSGKPVLCMETDEADAYSPEVSYRIKLHRESVLATYGIKTLQVWSFTYWSDPEFYLGMIQDRLT